MATHAACVIPTRPHQSIYAMVTAFNDDKIAAIRRGFPASDVAIVCQDLGLSYKTMFSVLGTKQQIGLRWLKQNRLLDASASERLLYVVQIQALAVVVLGDRLMAKQWLLAENDLLHVTPISLLDTGLGYTEVRRLLMSMASDPMQFLTPGIRQVG